MASAAAPTPACQHARSLAVHSRAKLFRQSEGEWKERCKGDLRLMKDKADGRVRVVMREDIMESLLRANHIVPPDAELVSAGACMIAYL